MLYEVIQDIIEPTSTVNIGCNNTWCEVNNHCGIVVMCPTPDPT